MRSKVLIFLSIFILAGFAWSFVYWSKNVKQPAAQPPKDLCADFSTIEGEISCEKARSLALAAYPGEVLKISLEEMPFGTGSEGRREKTVINKKVWLVKIQVPNSAPSEISVKNISHQEIAVDVVSGKIWLYRF